MRKVKARGAVEQVERPAIVTPLHVKDRSFVSEVAEGARTRRVLSGTKAWRKLSPLEAVYAKGQLAGGAHLAEARFAAGKRYGEIFVASETGGRDSTQMLNVSRSTGGLGIGLAQAAALRALARVEARLGERDRRIIRMVCGENFWPSEAVRAACGNDYKHATVPRFREAMDALVEGFD